MTRIYVPANLALLRELVETGELRPAVPVHMVTRALRAAEPDADMEDLEYTAFDDAALASLPLLAGQEPRRVVVSADVPDRLLTEREGTAAVLDGCVRLAKVAAVHVDDDDAAADIVAFAAAAEPDLDAVERHVLAWYAPSELRDLLSRTTSGGTRGR